MKNINYKEEFKRLEALLHKLQSTKTGQTVYRKALVKSIKLSVQELVKITKAITEEKTHVNQQFNKADNDVEDFSFPRRIDDENIRFDREGK